MAARVVAAAAVLLMGLHWFRRRRCRQRVPRIHSENHEDPNVFAMCAEDENDDGPMDRHAMYMLMAIQAALRHGLRDGAPLNRDDARVGAVIVTSATDHGRRQVCAQAEHNKLSICCLTWCSIQLYLLDGTAIHGHLRMLFLKMARVPRIVVFMPKKTRCCLPNGDCCDMRPFTQR